MRIQVEPSALSWLKRELGITSGHAVRFHVRYGGQPDIHPGFSLALSVERPAQTALQAEYEGILFYMKDDDLWYLDGRDLHVQFISDEDGVRFVVA